MNVKYTFISCPIRPSFDIFTRLLLLLFRPRVSILLSRRVSWSARFCHLPFECWNFSKRVDLFHHYSLCFICAGNGMADISTMTGTGENGTMESRRRRKSRERHHDGRCLLHDIAMAVTGKCERWTCTETTCTQTYSIHNEQTLKLARESRLPLSLSFLTFGSLSIYF